MTIDVQNLAGLVAALIRQPRIDALAPDLRPRLREHKTELQNISEGRNPDPVSIHALTELFAGALDAIEPNFAIVRAHGGDVEAFADLLVRHSLYNKLYLVDVRD